MRSLQVGYPSEESCVSQEVACLNILATLNHDQLGAAYDPYTNIVVGWIPEPQVKYASCKNREAPFTAASSTLIPSCFPAKFSIIQANVWIKLIRRLQSFFRNSHLRVTSYSGFMLNKLMLNKALDWCLTRGECYIIINMLDLELNGTSERRQAYKTKFAVLFQLVFNEAIILEWESFLQESATWWQKLSIGYAEKGRQKWGESREASLETVIP